MSAPWNRATGFFVNLPANIKAGYSYTPYEEIGGKSAADVLKQVNKVLQSTNTVLENHKEYLPPGQFLQLKKAYCRYHWQMTNELQADRTYYDEHIRESCIVSQLYADRASHQDRAKLLLREVETYQARVLSASRNAQPPETLVKFEDELTNLVATESNLHLEIEVRQAQSNLALAYDAKGEGFIVLVTHIPSHSNETQLPMDSTKAN
ncbi:hypothetical protein BN14_09523 [Rhizoctonia solani AG-1 IB]|uniref:Uncharacterized protein n=1 Tax=Thanatephorus cucumeris (strain AG1-IB / isolate 7/3/14) TaxID=1108050 RepID=M5C8L5_THACB|nr:hypothetical protein BN14_09523 [Rhizoctonia solani AG-1 IB]